jgi:hypothetical protein
MASNEEIDKDIEFIESNPLYDLLEEAERKFIDEILAKAPHLSGEADALRWAHARGARDAYQILLNTGATVEVSTQKGGNHG